MLRLLMLVLVLALALSPAPTDTAATLATFRGEAISEADFEIAIAGLPPSRRRVPAKDRFGWHEQILRDIALDRALADASPKPSPRLELIGLDDDEIDEALELFARRRLEGTLDPSEAEVRERFLAISERFERPESRWLRNLFLRIDDRSEPSAVVAEAEVLRERIASGEAFQAIARSHSDSRTAADGGLLGWVRRGDLPTAAADIVFGLEAGRPSPPIRTASGVHVFLVEDVTPPVHPRLDQVRGLVIQDLQQERLRREEDRLIAEALAEAGRVFRVESAQATSSVDEDAVIASIHGEQLLAGDIRKASAATDAPLDLEALVETWIVARDLTRRIGALDAVDRAHLETGWQRRRAQRHRSAVLRRMVEDRVRADRGSLENFYRRHRARFFTGMRLDLLELRIPFTDAAHARALVKQLRDSMDPERQQDLVALLESEGGRMPESRTIDADDLEREHPGSGRFLGETRSGQWTRVYRDGLEIKAFKLLKRHPPEQRPFEAVVEEVLAAYLAGYGPRIRQEVIDDLVNEDSLQVDPVRLGNLIAETFGD